VQDEQSRGEERPHSIIGDGAATERCGFPGRATSASTGDEHGRQVAERRYSAARATTTRLDRVTRATVAKTLLAEYHDEVARIAAEHQVWMVNHGVDVPAMPRRQSAGRHPGC